jgi:hypothetical protein
MSGNGIGKIGRRIVIKEKFIQLFGFDPEDMFGGDWENYVEEYLRDTDHDCKSGCSCGLGMDE